jgi:glycopeptide antibiotics resistance protein
VNFGLDTLIKKWTFVLSIGTLLGFIIEWIQYVLIPSRSGEWLDILANTLGLIAMLSSTYLLKRICVL